MLCCPQNLVELTGRAWENKVVGFVCAAGGQIELYVSDEYRFVSDARLPLGNCAAFCLCRWRWL